MNNSNKNKFIKPKPDIKKNEKNNFKELEKLIQEKTRELLSEKKYLNNYKI